MITADVFMEKVANGRIGKTGRFRVLLFTNRYHDADSVDTMLQRGDVSRVISYEKLLSLLPKLKTVLNLIPKMIAALLEVSDAGDTAVVAMGANIGWAFTERHPVKIMKEHVVKE